MERFQLCMYVIVIIREDVLMSPVFMVVVNLLMLKPNSLCVDKSNTHVVQLNAYGLSFIVF